MRVGCTVQADCPCPCTHTIDKPLETLLRLHSTLTLFSFFIRLQITDTPNTSSARSKTRSFKMFMIVAIIRNWRVDWRRVRDEAIRMLRILTGAL
ncbi:hypothetical protein B0H65DRAFT_87188 [Neurospora tetraspora]|uniref:Uncharacterized protein n=1 Tax=Neurospora tetraspora TaxID=94610 RepID=A0AAE0JIN6_9PEZI|nr:hypothetical protein B0H65DRAFT_87188 [Neurospora tetraspora]